MGKIDIEKPILVLKGLRVFLGLEIFLKTKLFVSSSLFRAKPFGKQKLKIPDSVEIQLRLAFCSHYRNLEELQNDPDFEYLCPDLGKFTSSDVSSSLHKENEALELLETD